MGLKGDEDLVQLLCENEADVNSPGGEYRSVLQAAFVSGNEKLVQFLFEKGAEAKVQGKTFIQKLVEMLLERSRIQTL